ncbi:MAG: MerR family transcriptional regulator [Actinomycetota bacterium]
MEYRVERLASACGVSVDTIRFYQSTGLLQAPAKEGRTAIYSSEHLERIRMIRALQKKGLTLNAIRRVVRGSKADQDLVAAVAQAASEELMTREELAQRSGVPESLLHAIEVQGLLMGRTVEGEQRFSASELELVKQGMRLLEAGVPLDELLKLAKKQSQAAYTIAFEAVRLFDEFIREPIKATSQNEQEETARLTSAFSELLPAVTDLVASHFRRVLLEVAEKRIEGIEELKKAAGWRAKR